MTSFLAVDGEAINDRYALLCSSDGDSLHRPEGLRSTQCLEFLLRHAQKGRTMVCFGLGYDANNWLADLKPMYLKELWTEQLTHWGEYRIEWLPGRWFSVRHVDGRFAKVCEAFGFYQSSFIRALEDWGHEVPDEIREGKLWRGKFTGAMVDKITGYCLLECDLLVKLMEQLRDACRAADISIKTGGWIGAGALAGALHRREQTSLHHVHDLDLAPDAQTAVDVILGAYFAGRIELLHQGVHTNVRGYDIRSAYPAQITRLPSLDGASFKHRKRYAPDAEHAIWRCEWDGLDGLVMPFPTRLKGAILYPTSGSGWYHAAEVRAARAVFGDRIRVWEGWVLKPRTDVTPFDWVPELYAKRARWKDAGNPAQKPLKLGLNSLYGKLAQGYGYRGAEPPWQSYFWAGEVTARTRAAMFTAAANSRRPVMIATDGLYAGQARAGDVKPSKQLGGWEHQRIDWLFAAQAGVYEAIHDGLSVVKSRGFFAKEVDYEQLRDAWDADGADGSYTYNSTRFNGLGSCLHRNRLDLWNTWTTEKRTLGLRPQRKVPLPDGRLAPIAGPVESEPYVPKMGLLEAREVSALLDIVQGQEQPMRETV